MDRIVDKPQMAGTTRRKQAAALGSLLLLSANCRAAHPGRAHAAANTLVEATSQGPPPDALALVRSSRADGKRRGSLAQEVRMKPVGVYRAGAQNCIQCPKTSVPLAGVETPPA